MGQAGPVCGRSGRREQHDAGWAAAGALSNGLRATAILTAAEALSFVKFSALLIALGVGIAAVAVTVGRLAMSGKTTKRWQKQMEGQVAGGPLVIPATADRAAPPDDSGRPPVALYAGRTGGGRCQPGRAHDGRRVSRHHRTGPTTPSASAYRAAASARRRWPWARCRACGRSRS